MKSYILKPLKFTLLPSILLYLICIIYTWSFTSPLTAIISTDYGWLRVIILIIELIVYFVLYHHYEREYTSKIKKALTRYETKDNYKDVGDVLSDTSFCSKYDKVKDRFAIGYNDEILVITRSGSKLENINKLIIQSNERPS